MKWNLSIIKNVKSIKMSNPLKITF